MPNHPTSRTKKELKKHIVAARDRALAGSSDSTTDKQKTTERSFPDTIDQARKSIVRVQVKYKNGEGGGTGFFCTPDAILTCAHVLLGHPDLRALKEQFLRADASADLKKEFMRFFEERIPVVTVELSDGTILPAEWVKIDARFDIGLIKVRGNFPQIIRRQKALRLGEEVFFCGFPIGANTDIEKNAFTVNAGFVSSLRKTVVGGYKNRDIIQVSAINLNGNSGAPLMLRSTGELLGIINGNMLIGHDAIMSVAQTPNGSVVQPVPFRVPIGVAYATDIEDGLSHCDFLREEMDVLGSEDNSGAR